MTAPLTGLAKQRRRHIGPLWGMTIVTVFAVAMMLYWIFETLDDADPQAPANATATEQKVPNPTLTPKSN